MPIPRIVSLKTDALQARNLSLSTWLKKENAVYITSQAKKYGNATEDSPWMPSRLSYRLYCKEISQEEFNNQYEAYIRREMWDQLKSLDGMELGCWCIEPESEHSQCHGKIIIKLFKEMTKQWVIVNFVLK